MHSWAVTLLPSAQDDVEALARNDRPLGDLLLDGIQEIARDEFKAKRLWAVLEGHARTAQIDRLEGSKYPKSFRLQLHHDYRATMLCLPLSRQVLVTHVFSKSADPVYRRALRTHDARLASYFDSLREYFEGARGRTNRS